MSELNSQSQPEFTLSPDTVRAWKDPLFRASFEGAFHFPHPGGDYEIVHKYWAAADNQDCVDTGCGNGPESVCTQVFACSTPTIGGQACPTLQITCPTAQCATHDIGDTSCNCDGS